MTVSYSKRRVSPLVTCGNVICFLVNIHGLPRDHLGQSLRLIFNLVSSSFSPFSNRLMLVKARYCIPIRLRLLGMRTRDGRIDTGLHFPNTCLQSELAVSLREIPAAILKCIPLREMDERRLDRSSIPRF